MLNVALVGLLAGSLAIGGGDSKNPQAGDKPAPDNAVPGIFTPSADAPLTPAVSPNTIQDTYAFGIADRRSPIRFWAHYAYGEAESAYNADGDDQEILIGSGQIGGANIGSQGDIVTQRGTFGGEIGLPVGLFGFGLGVGGQLQLAKNEFQLGEGAGDAGLAGIGDLESDFGLQEAKLYATASAGAISLHGGYVFDLGDNREFAAITAGPLAGSGAQIPTTLSTSDTRDAFFLGADFDYPVVGLRIFGSVDYYDLQANNDAADDPNPNTAENENDIDGDDVVNAMFGAGVKLSVFELGAALQVQTRLSNPLTRFTGNRDGIGSHLVSVAPYLRISPPSLPASIFIKGAVRDEYTEFGLPLAGANSIKPKIGFTAGLTVGFQ